MFIKVSCEFQKCLLAHEFRPNRVDYVYFILFLFTVVKMRAPSKGEFILSTESTVSAMGLEVERLEEFVKEMTYLALSAHHWEECSDWVLSSLGLHPDGAWR